jgi:uncharacterized membrane protein YkoI
MRHQISLSIAESLPYKNKNPANSLSWKNLMFPENLFMKSKSRIPKVAEWEFMCDAKSGKITETESEVSSVDDEAFKKNLKVTEKEAIAIALKAHPGTVQEVEYEIEENGDASYELDIVDDKGVETKVEVNAANGKIIEVTTEKWEIGEEADEKR